MSNIITRICLVFLILIAPLATAQNASANIFLPSAYQDTVSFAASVIGICQGQTTYGVRCTEGILGPSFTCGPDTPDFTVTEGPDSYVATKTSQIKSAILTETQTCIFQGTAEASCTVDLTITGSGRTTIRSTSSILAGTDIPQYYMFQMPVTANAQYLQATGSVCSGTARNTMTIALGGALSAVILMALFVL